MKEMPTSGGALSCAAAAAWRTLLTRPTRGASAAATRMRSRWRHAKASSDLVMWFRVAKGSLGMSPRALHAAAVTEAATPRAAYSQQRWKSLCCRARVIHRSTRTDLDHQWGPKCKGGPKQSLASCKTLATQRSYAFLAYNSACKPAPGALQQF